MPSFPRAIVMVPAKPREAAMGTPPNIRIKKAPKRI